VRECEFVTVMSMPVEGEHNALPYEIAGFCLGKEVDHHTHGGAEEVIVYYVIT